MIEKLLKNNRQWSRKWQQWKASFSVSILVMFTSAFFLAAGCAETKQTANYAGTKKGCVMKYKSRGYQQWKAVELCKRFP